MSFPIPGVWTLDTKDAKRDEKKRERSPSSFFFCQARSLQLASQYFRDDRLVSTARGGVARKHRHRTNLALFGQLMASFEYLLKDFIATTIDLTDVFDHQVMKADWLQLEVGRVLAQREAKSTVGALLIHPTLGWHSPKVVNDRYQDLFSFQPVAGDEVSTLNSLWLIRHSVAHNAGFMTSHDAFRLGTGDLSEKVMDIDTRFFRGTTEFLVQIAERIAENVGETALREWIRKRSTAKPDFTRDKATYERLKWLGVCLKSRVKDLPDFGDEDYSADWRRTTDSK